MRLGILVGHPTQFEAPFYRFASRDASHSVRVIYWDRKRVLEVFDPELGRIVDWGIDLLGGYDFDVLPVERKYRWLYNEFRLRRYDLLIINGYSRPELVFALAAARLLRIPIALRLDSIRRTNESFARRTLKRAVYPLLFRAYQHFFATSSRTVEYLESMGVEPKNISFFTYSVDQEWFLRESSLDESRLRKARTELGITNESLVVTAVSKLTSRETPWDLLEAAARLGRRDITYLIVGDGPDKPAVEAFAHRNPTIRILLPGYIQYTQLPAVYAISNVFVHSAKDEPYGVSVAEALSCGVPVIASSGVGSAADLVLHGSNGFRYEAGDIRALSGFIATAIEDLSPALTRQASSRVLKQWDYASTWSNILASSANG